MSVRPEFKLLLNKIFSLEYGDTESLLNILKKEHKYDPYNPEDYYIDEIITLLEISLNFTFGDDDSWVGNYYYDVLQNIDRFVVFKYIYKYIGYLLSKPILQKFDNGSKWFHGFYDDLYLGLNDVIESLYLAEDQTAFKYYVQMVINFFEYLKLLQIRRKLNDDNIFAPNETFNVTLDFMLFKADRLKNILFNITHNPEHKVIVDFAVLDHLDGEYIYSIMKKNIEALKKY